MVLKTAKISELLRQTEEKLANTLDAKGLGPELTEEHLASLPSKLQAQINNLLERKELLERAASPQNQKAYYGEKLWNKEFIPLSELESLDGSKLRGEALKTAVWQAFPMGPLKVFQELFVAPPDRIVTKGIKVDAVRGIVFSDRKALHDASVLPCLVSPDRVPDDFAQTIKLADFSENYGDPFGRLVKKADHTFILKLKKFFDSLEYLENGQFRVALISEATPERSVEYPPEITAPDSELLGKLLITREIAPELVSIGSDSKQLVTAPRRSAQIYQNPHRAMGRSQHIGRGYREETRVLGRLAAQVVTLNGKLDRSYHRGTPKEQKDELLDDARGILIKCVKVLEFCQNRFKIDARELISDAESFKDSLNRTNVSVAMNRMMTGVVALRKRSLEMRFKGPKIKRDQMALHEEATFAQELFAAYEKRAISVAAVIKSVQRGRNPEKTDLKADEKLNLKPEELSLVRLRPYTRFTEKLDELSKRFNLALNAKDTLTEAPVVLNRVSLVLRTLRLYHILEGARQDIRLQPDIDFNRLRVRVLGAKRLFEHPLPFSKAKTPEQDSFISEQINKLEKTAGRLAFYGREEKRGAELDRKQIFKDFKKYLDTFKPEEQIGSL